MAFYQHNNEVMLIEMVLFKDLQFYERIIWNFPEILQSLSQLLTNIGTDTLSKNKTSYLNAKYI